MFRDVARLFFVEIVTAQVSRHFRPSCASAAARLIRIDQRSSPACALVLVFAEAELWRLAPVVARGVLSRRGGKARMSPCGLAEEAKMSCTSARIFVGMLACRAVAQSNVACSR
jgi:hypothetical protein